VNPALVRVARVRVSSLLLRIVVVSAGRSIIYGLTFAEHSPGGDAFCAIEVGVPDQGEIGHEMQRN